MLVGVDGGPDAPRRKQCPPAAPVLKTHTQLVEEEAGAVDPVELVAGVAWLGQSGTTRSSAGVPDEQPE